MRVLDTRGDAIGGTGYMPDAKDGGPPVLSVHYFPATTQAFTTPTFS